MTMTPLVTIAVPSYNQGVFLNDALTSIFAQDLPVEVYVMDGGSTDNSLDVIRGWKDRIAGFRSFPDAGQASAINEGISKGLAPYVCWLNSDDWFLDGGLTKLVHELESHPETPAVYGRCWNFVQDTGKRYPVWVEAFNERRLALRCIVSQPGTLVRREAWNAVGGLNNQLHMAIEIITIR